MILSGCFNVKKNVQEAARILRLAAEITDNPDAQYQLYEIYHVYSNTKEINMVIHKSIIKILGTKYRITKFFKLSFL